MKLPYMQYVGNVSQDMRTGFGGLNLREDAGEGEFSEMQNLSGDRYPYLCARSPRRRVESPYNNLHGLYGCAEFMLMAIGSGVYKRVEEGDTITLSTISMTHQFSYTPKHFVRMGAYVLIWPDKMLYNTQTGALESIENEVSALGSVTVSQSNLAGEASDTATYLKIEADGIGSGFSAYDGVEISGLTGDAAALNGAHVLYGVTSGYILIAGIHAQSHTQTGGLTVKRKCPDMDFMTECGNRVWGCSSANHEIYACKLGDPKNWNCFIGIASDSYAATIGSDGDFTGAATVNDTVVFFKEATLHKVLGNKPANFQITTTPGRGVMAGCSGSARMVDETLFYVSREGVMAYDGAIPIGVGDALGTLALKNAIAEGWQGKYYLNALDGEDNPVQLVFNARRRLWYREDDTRMLYFVRAQNRLYAVNSSGRLLSLSDGQAQHETVRWSAQTGRILLETPGHKYVSSLVLHIDCAPGSPVREHPPRVSIQYDGGAWEDFIVTPPAGAGLVYRANIRTRRASYARLRIEGEGDVTLFGLSKTFEQGTELGRSSAR